MQHCMTRQSDTREHEKRKEREEGEEKRRSDSIVVVGRCNVDSNRN